MNIFAFVFLALKRLWHRLVLALLLILSISLTVGVMVCVPVFAGAVTRAIMQEEIANKTRALNRPPFSVRFYALPTVTHPITLDDAVYARQWLMQDIAARLRLPVTAFYAQYESPALRMRPRPDDPHYSGEEFGSVHVICIEGGEAHVEAAVGEPFGSGLRPDELSVWVSPRFAEKWGLQVGERYQLAYFFRSDETPLNLRIAGFWQARDPGGRFWYSDPEKFGDVLLTTPEQYKAYIAPITPEGMGFAFWYYILDDARMNFDRAPDYINALKMIEREVEARLPQGKMDYAPKTELEAGQKRKVSLQLILLGFSLPLMGILVFFIASVSTIVARYQMRETAILVSRGTSRIQVGLLILLETLITVALAYPLGLYLGLRIARAMGYFSSFLTLGTRIPFEVSLAAADQRMIGAALGVSLVARLLPTLFATRLTIVTYEHQASRQRYVLGAARLLVMGFLVAATYYAYQQLSLRGNLSLLGWRLGDNPWRDPLLLLAPTLFLFTAPLAASELFVLLVHALALVGRLAPGSAVFLGCINLGREGGQYRVPTYLLVLCLSLGVFYASLAKSADIWLVERLRYQVGADLTFEHGTDEQSDLGAWLLPAEEYRRIPGVARAARVGEYQAYLGMDNKRFPKLRLMGIDRLGFGEVAYFQDTFADYPLGEMLNRLGANLDGVLISQKTAAQLALAEGDALPLDILIEGNLYRTPFKIVGTFRYFPTMYESQATLAVANLEYIYQKTGGAQPHKIWIRLEEGADSSEVLANVPSLNVLPARPVELPMLIKRDQQRWERVGIFGLLSVCFLAGALLSGAGLLVYNWAALEGRVVRFAVLRAMGMSPSEVISAVTVEYIVTLLFGMLAGAALGLVSAYLYVPFFPLTDNPGVPIPPFVPYVDWDRAGWMALIMGVVLIVVEGAILWRVARARLFEVLRLGARV